MYEKPRVNVKVEPRSTFTFMSDLPYNVSNLFTHVKPVKVYVCTHVKIWKSTFKARLHWRFLSRQLDPTFVLLRLHQVSNMLETPAISRRQIALKIAPGLHVRFWSCRFSATKIACVNGPLGSHPCEVDIPETDISPTRTSSEVKLSFR